MCGYDWIRDAKNPAHLQTCFGGRFWPQNEEGFVDSAPIPFSWESGNQWTNRFLKTEASLIFKPGQSPNTCIKQTNDMQNTAQVFFSNFAFC